MIFVCGFCIVLYVKRRRWLYCTVDEMVRVMHGALRRFSGPEQRMRTAVWTDWERTSAADCSNLKVDIVIEGGGFGLL